MKKPWITPKEAMYWEKETFRMQEKLDAEEPIDRYDPKTGQWYREFGELMIPITGKGGDPIVQMTENTHPKDEMTEKEYMEQVRELQEEYPEYTVIAHPDEEEKKAESETKESPKPAEEAEPENPEEEETQLPKTLLKYGAMRRDYLKEFRPKEYNRMLKDGTLKEHCLEIQDRADELEDSILKRLLETEGGMRERKLGHTIEYLRILNNCLERAEEVVLNQIVYS